MSDPKPVTVLDMLGQFVQPPSRGPVVIGQNVNEPFKSTEIAIIVHRADGTIEDYGVVSYWHRNPLRRLAYRIRRAFFKPRVTHA
jgi:hypothetical protein